MKFSTLTNSIIITGVVAGFIFLFLPSYASAAINGENGPIVYIEYNSPREDDLVGKVNINDGIDSNKVITTNNQGESQQTVAETIDPITAVGISPPKPDNIYDIAYATETSNESLCNLNENTCAEINKVTVDGAGSPVIPSQPLTTIHSLFDTNESPSNTKATNLSYSPDGQTVLATIFSQNSQENILSAVYEINNANGSQTTIVSPRSDPCLNAGYADNGYIFYSLLNTENYIFYCQSPNLIESKYIVQSDIWVKKPGQDPQNITNTENISEFFIDVSPDNKFVLVVDVNNNDGYECNYALNVISKDASYWPFDCKYYLVNTETGESTFIDIPYSFVPAYFSPDNTSIIGTNWPLPEIGLRSFVDTNLTYTATLNLATMEITALTNTIGVQQWSPKLAQTETIPSQAVTKITTTKANTATTLPATGMSSYLLIGLAVLLITSPIAIYIKQK